MDNKLETDLKKKIDKWLFECSPEEVIRKRLLGERTGVRMWNWVKPVLLVIFTDQYKAWTVGDILRVMKKKRTEEGSGYCAFRDVPDKIMEEGITGALRYLKNKKSLRGLRELNIDFDKIEIYDAKIDNFMDKWEIRIIKKNPHNKIKELLSKKKGYD